MNHKVKTYLRPISTMEFKFKKEDSDNIGGVVVFQPNKLYEIFDENVNSYFIGRDSFCIVLDKDIVYENFIEEKRILQ